MRRKFFKKFSCNTPYVVTNWIMQRFVACNSTQTNHPPIRSIMKKHLLSALLLACVSVSASNAEVIYLNNFGNNTGAEIAANHSNVGWRVLRAQTGGGNATDESGTANAFVGVSFYAGRVQNAANVNAPLSLSDTNGLAYLGNGAGVAARYTGLFYTEQYVVDRSLYAIDSFQWYANATAGSLSEQNVAIRIGSQWYISSEAFSPAAGNASNFASTAQQFTLSFDTASWYTLTAQAGSPFSIGTETVSLPGGDIDAFGLYLTPSSTGIASVTTRFDTFTINVVPEPSSVLLLALAAGAGIARRRHRLKSQ